VWHRNCTYSVAQRNCTYSVTQRNCTYSVAQRNCTYSVAQRNCAYSVARGNLPNTQTDQDTLLPCSQRTASQSATARSRKHTRTQYIFVTGPESSVTVSNHSRHCKLCVSQFVYLFILLNPISAHLYIVTKLYLYQYRDTCVCIIPYPQCV